MSMSNNRSRKSGQQPLQSQRQLKVAELISMSVINCLRKGKGLDIRLYDMPLTITKVKVSADLRIASCYFLPFNTKLALEDISDALESSKYVIRHYVTKEINLKYSPELRFFHDDAFLNAARVEQLLSNLK